MPWVVRDPVERFWEKVDKNGPVIMPELGACWLYVGTKGHAGAGQFWNGERQVQAQAFSWSLVNGPVPAGVCVLQRCQMRSRCVNPAHLYLGWPKTGPKPAAREDYFWQRVNKNGPTQYPHLGPCWEWTGTRNRWGYGYFEIQSHPRRRTLAHRFAWELQHGPIPEGLFVLHACDHPPCCAYRHLFLGTQADNIQDKMNKGRQPTGERTGMYTHPEARLIRVRGEQTPSHKLTWAKVDAIRLLYSQGWSRAQLGREFGVSATVIFHIVHGNKWKEEFRPRN